MEQRRQPSTQSRPATLIERPASAPLCAPSSDAVPLADHSAQWPCPHSAYESGPPIATAKAVVDRHLDGLFDSRYEDVHVAASNDIWCDWFYDVVSLWDVTWVVTGLRNDRTTLVCVTDTD
jgi:hypothetical protein